MKSAVRAIGVVLTISLFAGTPVAGDRIVFVPWKVLERGAEVPPNTTLVLYWIPSSGEEMRRSDLITSPVLASYAAKCVAMHVIRADDEVRLFKLGVANELPTAILVDGDQQLARVGNAKTAFRSFDVEMMIRRELERRQHDTESRLEEANKYCDAHQWAEALAAYQQVAAQKCAFPRLAKTAERALKKVQPMVSSLQK